MATSSWQAEEELIATAGDGKRLALTVKIGTPIRVGPDEWSCPVAVNGLVDELRPLRGASSLQAMCLATTLARRILEDLVAQGGRPTYRGSDGDFDIEATFSGVGGPA